LHVLLPSAVAVALLCVVLAIAWRNARAKPRQALAASSQTESWARGAGEEFAALSEPQRCDLIFALGALDEDGDQALLERALDDPSENVALAAACVLARTGHGSLLERYVVAHPGARARSIEETLELLA
jgi:HEAT repeat protein